MLAEDGEQITPLPEPSAALSALRMLLLAHLRTLGRRKAEAWLREIALIVTNEETIRSLHPKRPKHERAAVARAQDEAAAWLSAVLPELVRMLPPE